MNIALSTAHSTAFSIKDNPYLPCSAAIKFHNITLLQHTIQTQPTVSAFKTDHICHAQYSNYIAATHNITHSPCTLHTQHYPPHCLPQPSYAHQLKNTKHSWQNGTRRRDGVKLLWCHSHLVFWGFYPYIHLFSFRNLFCDF